MIRSKLTQCGPKNDRNRILNHVCSVSDKHFSPLHLNIYSFIFKDVINDSIEPRNEAESRAILLIALFLVYEHNLHGLSSNPMRVLSYRQGELVNHNMF